MRRRLGVLLTAFVTVAVTVSCSSAPPPPASTTPTAAPTTGTAPTSGISPTAAPTTGTAPSAAATAAPTSGTQPTAAATVTLEVASAATGTVGSDGGTITAGNLALTIPAGALTKQVAITVTPISGIGGTPLDDGFLGGAQLEPDGLRFLKPAILSMPLPAGTTAANVVGFGYAGQGASFHLSPHETAGATIKLILWHFSGGGAATADAAAVAEVASSPLPLSQAGMQAEQDFAAADFTLQQALANGVDQDTALAAWSAAARAAIDRWYTNGIRPALLAARDGTFEEFDSAFVEFFEWIAYILAGLGGPGSAAQRAEGQQLANTAAAAQANRLLDLCGAGDLSGPLGPLTELKALALGGFVSLGPAGLPADLISACAHPKIEVVDFPAVAALGGPNTLRGRVTVDVHNGPDRTDLPTTLTVGGSPVTVDASGNFQTTVTPTANPLNTLIIAQVTSFGGSSVQLQRPVRDRIELEALSPINALHPGDSVTLVVRVAGDGMSNGTVDYALSGVGQLSTASGTTNADGEVPDFDYSVPANSPPGIGTVTATFQGATDSLTITSTPTVTVTTLFAGSVIVTIRGTNTFDDGTRNRIDATITFDVEVTVDRDSNPTATRGTVRADFTAKEAGPGCSSTFTFAGSSSEPDVYLEDGEVGISAEVEGTLRERKTCTGGFSGTSVDDFSFDVPDGVRGTLVFTAAGELQAFVWAGQETADGIGVGANDDVQVRVSGRLDRVP